MNKTRLILGGLLGLVLAVAALLVVGLNLDPKAFSGQISRIIKDTTALDVAFEGDIKLHYFPWLGVDITQVGVMAPKEAGGGFLARIGRAEVKIRPLALLSRQVQAGTIVIEGLELHLKRDEQGRLNLPSPPVRDVKLEKNKVVVTTNQGVVYTLDYQLDGVEVKSSSLDLDDSLTKSHLAIANLNLKTGKVASGKPSQVSLGFDYISANPQCSGRVDLSGQVLAEPENLQFSLSDTKLSAGIAGPTLPVASGTANLSGSMSLDGRTLRLAANKLQAQLQAKGKALPESGAEMTLGLDQAQVDMTAGTADLTGLSLKTYDLSLTGEAHGRDLNASANISAKLASNDFSPRQVLSKLGLAWAQGLNSQALNKAVLAVSLESSQDKVLAKSEKFILDDCNLSWEATWQRAGKGRLDFTLKADNLDADRYIPSGSGSPKAEATAQAKPLEIPIDVQGTVEIGRLRAAKLRMENVSAQIKALNNKIVVDPLSLNLYQGGVKGSARADLTVQPPTEAVSLSAESVQVEALLQDLTGKGRIAGRASLSANLATKGLDEKQLMSGLNGKASFAVRNGAVQGFNLSPEVFTSKDKLLAEAKGQGRTEFEVISASFLVNGGQAKTSDLLVSAPPNKVTAQGVMNLASRTMDFQAQVVFLHLPSIPLRLAGNMEDPNVSLDTAGMAKGVIETVVKAPGEVISAPQNVGKSVLDTVGNIFGGKKK